MLLSGGAVRPRTGASTKIVALTVEFAPGGV